MPYMLTTPWPDRFYIPGLHTMRQWERTVTRAGKGEAARGNSAGTLEITGQKEHPPRNSHTQSLRAPPVRFPSGIWCLGRAGFQTSRPQRHSEAQPASHIYTINSASSFFHTWFLNVTGRLHAKNQSQHQLLLKQPLDSISLWEKHNEPFLTSPQNKQTNK